jgi:alpha-L-fucosidase 2
METPYDKQDGVISTTSGYMGGPGKAAPRGHRHWSHLIMIYPYYQVNWDQPEQRELIERSWRYWAWDRVPNAWSQAVMSSMASSMGVDKFHVALM